MEFRFWKSIIVDEYMCVILPVSDRIHHCGVFGIDVRRIRSVMCVPNTEVVDDRPPSKTVNDEADRSRWEYIYISLPRNGTEPNCYIV